MFLTFKNHLKIDTIVTNKLATIYPTCVDADECHEIIIISFAFFLPDNLCTTLLQYYSTYKKV